MIDVGFASNIIAMRLTHSGEDGFVLYVPSEVSIEGATRQSSWQYFKMKLVFLTLVFGMNLHMYMYFIYFLFHSFLIIEICAFNILS